MKLNKQWNKRSIIHCYIYVARLQGTPMTSSGCELSTECPANDVLPCNNVLLMMLMRGITCPLSVPEYEQEAGHIVIISR